MEGWRFVFLSNPLVIRPQSSSAYLPVVTVVFPLAVSLYCENPPCIRAELSERARGKEREKKRESREREKLKGRSLVSVYGNVQRVKAARGLYIIGARAMMVSERGGKTTKQLANCRAARLYEIVSHTNIPPLLLATCIVVSYDERWKIRTTTNEKKSNIFNPQFSRMIFAPLFSFLFRFSALSSALISRDK